MTAAGGADPAWHEPIPTLTRFHGHLEFFASPEARHALLEFITAVTRIGASLEARPRRSAMHTAYRAKTRHRNRRRR